MDVCDKVTTEDSGAKDAVASMIKRLAHRNANVQLYTLEVRGAAASLIHRVLLIFALASQRPQPELRSKNAPRACLESLHGCPSSTGQ